MQWWPLLLGGAIALMATGRNVPMGVVFALHLIGMQLIKWLNLPQEQLLFASVYAVMGVVAMLYFDKLAAFCLAMLSMVYIASQAGYIEPLLRMKMADGVMIMAMVFGALNGPDFGLRAGRFNSGLIEFMGFDLYGAGGPISVSETHSKNTQSD